MQFSTLFTTALMGSLAAAQAVHVVSVGSSDGDATFSPSAVNAAQGDMIQFQFRAGNHTVTQSTFDAPCAPMGAGNVTGIYSGYMPVAASEAMGLIPTYTIMVADTNPMWFYCSQGRHCQNGMVMVVNENPTGNSTRTLANFMNAAAAVEANLDGDANDVDPGSAGTVPEQDNDTDAEGASVAAGFTVPSALIALGAAVAILL